MAELSEEQWNQALALYDAGQRSEAAAVWHEILTRDPNIAEARFNRGVALYESDHVEEAIVEWRETVRRCPEFLQAYERLGHTFWHLYRQHKKRSDLQASWEAYKQASEICPDNADTLCSLGVMGWKLGNRRDAVTYLHRAIIADTTSIVAHERLIWCQLHSGHWAAAWRTIYKLMELPTFVATRYQFNDRLLLLRWAFPAAALGSIVLVGRIMIKRDKR